jgi:hypothetical protein
MLPVRYTYRFHHGDVHVRIPFKSEGGLSE